MKVICFIGPKGHGKDTAAQYMAQYLDSKKKTGAILPLAQYLKQVGTRTFGYDDSKKNQGHREKLIELADAIRSVEPFAFINAWESLVRSDAWDENRTRDYYLVPDVRLEREIDFFRDKYSAEFVLIYRPDMLASADSTHETEELAVRFARLHASRNPVPNWISKVLVNNDLPTLKNEAQNIVRRI